MGINKWINNWKKHKEQKVERRRVTEEFVESIMPNLNSLGFYLRESLEIMDYYSDYLEKHNLLDSALELRGQYENVDKFHESLLELLYKYGEKSLMKSPFKSMLGKMVLVSSGKFLMGTSDEQIKILLDKFPDWDAKWFENETPQNSIYLDSYYIDIYPVTNGQYIRFLENSGYKVKGIWKIMDPRKINDKINHPAVGLNWYDAMAYAEWAGKRLPTEAEWEKAARGTDARIWPWGNDWNPNNCHSSVGKDTRKTTEVLSIPNGNSPYGCSDMSGNVWEWCSDWYIPKHYMEQKDRNPRGPTAGEFRVLRGGSYWHESPADLRTAYRNGGNPNDSDRYWGFRCVKDV